MKEVKPQFTRKAQVGGDVLEPHEGGSRRTNYQSHLGRKSGENPWRVSYTKGDVPGQVMAVGTEEVV